MRPTDDETASDHAERPIGLGRTLRGEFSRYTMVAAMLAALAWACVSIWRDIGRGDQPLPATTAGTLPGEFEYHEGLAVGWSSKLPAQEHGVLVEILRQAQGRAALHWIVKEPYQIAEARQLLAEKGLEPSQVKFIQSPTASIWSRDFMPRMLRTAAGRSRAVGFEFSPRVDRWRHVVELMRHFTDDFAVAPLAFEGGNLLSNGRGLLLATTQLLDRNRRRGTDDAETRQRISQYFGAREVVFLEPLKGEPTGHVDMFATFTAPDTVVVAKVSAQRDSLNAMVLDENVRRLSNVTTDSGPLRVVRVEMPPIAGGYARSYTNVVYVNGLLLFPTYGAEYAGLEARARETYRELLPNWKIVDIDSSGLLLGHGSLHCATMNLFRVPKSERVGAAANEHRAPDP